jgi:N-acetylneuraminic acid mutarotase
VYIIGGQQADGSGIGFPDHYAFDPQALAFSQLPTENAPPAIYGHVSIMFPDGRLFVFGGASQGTLIPLSTIWVLDTSTNALTWTQLQADNSTIPSPRRAFAAVAIGDGKILLQGGSDVSLQTNLDDGWILDTSQNPVVWAPVEQLSQIGARRDHFAVSSNGLVLFDFGEKAAVSWLDVYLLET